MIMISSIYVVDVTVDQASLWDQTGKDARISMSVNSIMEVANRYNFFIPNKKVRKFSP